MGGEVNLEEFCVVDKSKWILNILLIQFLDVRTKKKLQIAYE